jgi:5'(3')-deoxyribonucleotidase
MRKQIDIDNILVTFDGMVVSVPAGASHDIICQDQFSYTLNKFLLKCKGLRIRVFNKEIAIEFYSKLSVKQLAVIKRFLRNKDFYTVTTPHNHKRSFRPIRSLSSEQLQLVQ